MKPCYILAESLVLPFESALMISHVEIDGKTDGNSSEDHTESTYNYRVVYLNSHGEISCHNEIAHPGEMTTAK